MNKTQKAIIGFVAGGLLALGVASPAVAGGDYVKSYTPTIEVTCDTLTFSHPQFKGAWGKSESLKYELVLDGVSGGKLPMGHGQSVMYEFDAYVAHSWQVTVWAVYAGESFHHQLGQSKGVTEPCAVPVPEYTEVEYLPPQFVDVCGTENDEVQVPSDTEGVTYSVEWINDYTVVVTATVNEGFAFRYGDGALYSMVTENYVFDTEPCPSPVDPAPPVAENPVEVETLAETGLDGITAAGWLVIGFGLLTAGVAALAMRRESGVRRKGTN